MLYIEDLPLKFENVRITFYLFIPTLPNFSYLEELPSLNLCLTKLCHFSFFFLNSCTGTFLFDKPAHIALMKFGRASLFLYLNSQLREGHLRFDKLQILQRDLLFSFHIRIHLYDSARIFIIRFLSNLSEPLSGPSQIISYQSYWRTQCADSPFFAS